MTRGWFIKFSSLIFVPLYFISSVSLILINSENAWAAACSPEQSTFVGDGASGLYGVSYTLMEFKNEGSCSWTVPRNLNVDVLIVGGGGGAGFGSNGGGGGAGQVVTNNSSLSLSSGTVISITVGSGGSGGWALSGSSWNYGGNGTSSSFGAYATASGGGGGGGNNGSLGRSGGSGGGGAGSSANGEGLTGGSGSTSTNSGWTARGNTGGAGASGRGGGGGGASANGTNGVSGAAGGGGNGVTIFGKSVGGGGAAWGASGNNFGGGNGVVTNYSVSNACSPTCAGSANTGGGGGGGNVGGSGLVAVRYLSDTTAPTFTSSSSFSAAENIAITSAAATIKVSESATVTISSGADSALFTISNSDTVTALIKFKASPNYEAPSDSGGNNVYDLVLTATDSASNAGTQTITITVTDVVDTSSFNSFALAGGASAATYRSTIQINASVTTASKVTFRAANVVIAGCKGKLATGSGTTYTVSCSWKPAKRGSITLSATSIPTNVAISGATATPISVSVLNRSTPR